MQVFHEDSHEAAGEPGEKESGHPLPVPGVGDEAFWTGNVVVGALYVLKGDAYLRISIGASDDQAVRIDKSRALARKAMARL